MLQKLNERIQGVVAWLVVILVCITFTIFGVDYYMQSHQTTNSKVEVNGNSITVQAFEANYRRARGAQDVEQMSAEDEKKLHKEVLDQMIANQVMVEAAHKNGFEVSANLANMAIVKIPQFQEDGKFSTEKFQQTLSAQLFTQISFQNEVKQGMLLNQQRFSFIGGSFALPDEINRYVRLYMQNRDYDYLRLPASAFKKEVKVSSQAIADYYKTHQKEFMTPEQVSLDYVILSMEDIKKQIKISKADVEKFYNENQSNYLAPAHWKVAHILFAVSEGISNEELELIQKKADDAYLMLQKDPKQFEKLVATVSDDKLSLLQKGELPWIVAGQTKYDKILSKLTKRGEISSPEKTKYGYEVFKLIDHKPAIIKPLVKVEKTIREQLATEMIQTQYAKVLEHLSDLSYQYPDSLNSISDTLKLKIIKTQPFSRNGATDPLTQKPQIINAAFSYDVLELGNNSDPIQLDNDSVVVLRVNQHMPEKGQSLEIVRDKISAILVQKMAESKAKELGMTLLNQLDNKKQSDILGLNKLKWLSVRHSSRDNDQVEPLINELAFNLLEPESREGIALANGDYVVVRLKQINDGNLSSLDKEQQDSLTQQIEANYGMMDYDLYEKSLINQAKVLMH